VVDLGRLPAGMGGRVRRGLPGPPGTAGVALDASVGLAGIAGVPLRLAEWAGSGGCPGEEAARTPAGEGGVAGHPLRLEAPTP
jgi:hypothetical protein